MREGGTSMRHSVIYNCEQFSIDRNSLESNKPRYPYINYENNSHFSSLFERHYKEKKLNKNDEEIENRANGYMVIVNYV